MRLWVVVSCLLVVSCPLRTARAFRCDHSVVSLQGSNATEVGESYGKQCGDSIAFMLSMKKLQFADVLNEWYELALGSLPSIKQYLPSYLEELHGIASGAEQFNVTFEDLLLLATEYEAELAFPQDDSAKKCTGFGSFQQSTGLLTGQNNDESPSRWNNASNDLILNMNQQLLVYTHPGVPAYMGLNAQGLAVTWYYVDSGDRDHSGLPTTVLIRTLLEHCASIQDVKAFFGSVRVSLPNSFIVSSRKDNASVVVEVSPSYGVQFLTSAQGEWSVAHANNVLINAQMWQHEVADVFAEPSHLSVDRYRTLSQWLLNTQNNSRSVSQCKAGLSLNPVYNDHTLVSLLFELNQLTLHYRFYAEQEWNHTSLSH